MSSSVESARELSNDKTVSLTLVHAVCTFKRRHDLDIKLSRFKPLPLDDVFCWHVTLLVALYKSVAVSVKSNDACENWHRWPKSTLKSIKSVNCSYYFYSLVKFTKIYMFFELKFHQARASLHIFLAPWFWNTVTSPKLLYHYFYTMFNLKIEKLYKKGEEQVKVSLTQSLTTLVSWFDDEKGRSFLM